MGTNYQPQLVSWSRISKKKNINNKIHGDPMGTKHKFEQKNMASAMELHIPTNQPINGVLSLLGAQQWMGPGLQ